MSKTSAILGGKCPKCRKGKLFPFAAYNIPKFAQMNETCPKCNVSLVPEPGFYIGAMYISYAFSVAIFVTVGVILWYFEISSVVTFISVILAAVILLLPLLFRYSRILFLHLFGGIDFDAKHIN